MRPIIVTTSGGPGAMVVAAICGVLVLASAGVEPALPTAREIIARYDQALGGQTALRRHTSSTMRGTVTMAAATGDVTRSFVYYAGAPYRRLEEVSLAEHQGEVLYAFDGQEAWSFDPRSGAQIYSGDERESMKRDADFYYPINELSWFKSMTTAGIEDFEGHACYRLQGLTNWNKTNVQFFDRTTSLLAGYEFDSELGPTHEIFSDYRVIDGVLVPMKRVVKVKSKDGVWAVRQTLLVLSVTFNDVDPSVFTPPGAVRDLLAKEKERS
jgi:hypothetical protein